MREIKFRAWDKKAKKFIPTRNIVWNDNGLVGINMGFSRKEKRFIGNIKIMQYTGLKDKNGKDIYEGDLIKDDEGEIEEVKPPEIFECDAFKVYGYKFCSGHFIDARGEKTLERFYSHQPEIIGNIYENPDLIKDN